MTQADHDELRRLAEAALEPHPSPDTVVRETRISAAQPGPVVVMDARDILALLDEIKALRRIGRALLEHDERGQGVGWAETMDALHKLLGTDSNS